MTGQLLPVNVQRDEDAALGEAWRRVEAAIPDGWQFRGIARQFGDDDWRAWAVVKHGPAEIIDCGETTALEALTSLAEALEARHDAARLARRPSPSR